MTALLQKRRNSPSKWWPKDGDENHSNHGLHERPNDFRGNPRRINGPEVSGHSGAPPREHNRRDDVDHDESDAYRRENHLGPSIVKFVLSSGRHLKRHQQLIGRRFKFFLGTVANHRVLSFSNDELGCAHAKNRMGEIQSTHAKPRFEMENDASKRTFDIHNVVSVLQQNWFKILSRVVHVLFRFDVRLSRRPMHQRWSMWSTWSISGVDNSSATNSSSITFSLSKWKMRLKTRSLSTQKIAKHTRLVNATSAVSVK
jgi:hypothetical protein